MRKEILLVESYGSTLSTEFASLNKLIPDCVYENLPEPLKQLTEKFEGRERDIILLSSLGVISSCLPNVYGIYRTNRVSCNLYLFIIAPPASGKGVMNWTKKLIEPIHEAMVSDSRRGIKEYKLSKDYTLPEPKLQIKIIPGNISSSKLYSHLETAKDGVLIFESEADSLSGMLKHEWGSFSDILRKAFHHETISISRQVDDRYFEIKNPKISIVISGTPNQVKPLINSKENGLFSRFLFYSYDEVTGWKDVSPNACFENYDSLFESKSQEIKNIYEKLSMKEVEIKLTDDQWRKFQSPFEIATDVTIETGELGFLSVIKRLGVIMFRICMVLTVIRNKERLNDENQVFYVDDIDLDSTMEILQVLQSHSLLVSEMYEKQSLKMSIQEKEFYNLLPQKFKRSEGLELASTISLPERTYDDLLFRWTKNKVIEKISQGIYIKLSIK